MPLPGISLERVSVDLSRRSRELCCEITTRCSLECCVCFASATPADAIDLSVADFLRAVALSRSSLMRLTFTGGEPTLSPHFARFLLEARRHGVPYVLSTAGAPPTLVDRYLMHHPPSAVYVSLHGLQTTHDGFTRRVGSFKKAVQLCKALVAAGIPVHILTTCAEEVARDLVPLSHFLRGLRIEEHRLNLIKNRGRLDSSPADPDAVLSLALSMRSNLRTTVKSADQPFQMLLASGVLEARHGR